ncbi:alpha/beta hydrolase [Streptomyces sp. SAS_270]|uniref:alpha/beta hydrolase n=1 Tax=Streptomyces sp. SAS_270 TaxID=3412748 RepID=UPI00403C5DF0
MRRHRGGGRHGENTGPLTPTGHQFAADVPENTTDLMAVTQRPVTSSALEEGASEPAWKTIPSWVLIATEDLNIPPQAQTFMAKRAKAHTVEVKPSHAVSVSRQDAVAAIIEKAGADGPLTAPHGVASGPRSDEYGSYGALRREAGRHLHCPALPELSQIAWLHCLNQ